MSVSSARSDDGDGCQRRQAFFVDLGRCSDALDTPSFPHSPRRPSAFVLFRSRSLFLSFSQPSAFEMPQAIYLLLISLVLVVAHPITGDSQAIIGGKSPSEYQGWFDPRVNGGRFLDVRPRSNDVDRIKAVTDVLSDAVHEPQASIPRRASEHHHHRPFRPLHPHRRRPSDILQVGIFPPNRLHPD